MDRAGWKCGYSPPAYMCVHCPLPPTGAPSKPHLELLVQVRISPPPPSPSPSRCMTRTSPRAARAGAVGRGSAGPRTADTSGTGCQIRPGPASRTCPKVWGKWMTTLPRTASTRGTDCQSLLDPASRTWPKMWESVNTNVPNQPRHFPPKHTHTPDARLHTQLQQQHEQQRCRDMRVAVHEAKQQLRRETSGARPRRKWHAWRLHGGPAGGCRRGPLALLTGADTACSEWQGTRALLCVEG